ncbi:MAG: hypothetical protein AB1762_09670 [Gemmatimonadota bacterium]
MARRVFTLYCSIALAVLCACGGDATGGNSPDTRASLTVNIGGIPETMSATVTVTDKKGFSRVLTRSGTISGLTPGAYTVLAANTESESASYAPLLASQSVTLTRGSTQAVDVTYALANGVLSLSIAGLPESTPGAVRIEGPNGYSKQFTASTTLSRLAAGSYTVSAEAVTASGDGYAAPSPTRAIEVQMGGAEVSVAFEYALVTGRLQIHANGLPSLTSTTFQIDGPNGFSRAATAEEVLKGLTPGSYTVTSPNVAVAAQTYVPSPSSVTIQVAASMVPSDAAFAFALAGSSLVNLTVDNLYITQAVQTYSRDVPLVADRDGLVRVFVKASGPNTLRPQVRVRLYNEATLMHALTLDAPSASVPMTVDDNSLTSAWYGHVPGAFLQPGLRVIAEVDAANMIAEGAEADNVWPASGLAESIMVKSVPPFRVRFVPIQQSNGLTGDVSSANAAAFLTDVRRMYPLGAVDIEVRAPYTTSAPVVAANDFNGGWNLLLSELYALRAAEASTRNYYGVVKTSYSSGVAGIGLLGLPVAVGWDFLPGAADVLAHEVGHNWGRYHAPGCGAGSPDPYYPYAGGIIGASGFDLTTSTFKPATLADIMSYCLPAWASDFTYNGIMQFRESDPANYPAMQTRASEPGVLVWGRISQSEVVLEPAFDVVAPAKLPARGGSSRIEGYADDGALLFSLPFDGERVDHGTRDDRHFAFVIPRSSLRGRALGALRLRAGGRISEHHSSGASEQALRRQGTAAPHVRRRSGTTAEVGWSEPGVRGVMLRDARTGTILSLMRSAQTVAIAADSVEMVVSDGVRSHTRRVAVR